MTDTMTYTCPYCRRPSTGEGASCPNCGAPVDIALRTVADHLGKTVAVGIGNEQSPWPSIDFAEALAGLTNRRRVDDRQSFGDVLAQHTVEQRLVAVLQGAQINVLVQIVPASGEFVPNMFDLLTESLHHSRQ